MAVSLAPQRGPDLLNLKQTNFVSEGFLNIPLELLSQDEASQIINILLNKVSSMRNREAEFTGTELTGQSTSLLEATSSQEKKSVCEEMPKSSHIKNKVCMCTYCRTKHILGYMNCSMYGRRCSHCTAKE